MRILRGVGSRTLQCGCLIGLYETYSQQTVAVIDARASSCLDAAHRVNATVPFDILPEPRLPFFDTSRPNETPR